MTDNELIAEFMGFPAWETYVDFGGMREEKKRLRKMQYHTSWDWLMPVVEKIANELEKDWPRASDGALSLRIGTPISVVYANVVEFIKWYNQSKP